ncbi:MAG: SGNH/GDSL hydrolase family protein [Myxococcales bacterium]|nr:SGNH/GDSL hydrolase family protein [Myxococcales bacterium]
MPTRERLSILLGALGLVATVLTGGLAGAGGVRGVSVLAGKVQVDGDDLVLAANATVGIGDGTSILATGTFPGGAVDIGRGPHDGANVYAQFGPVSGLYRDDGTTVGDDPRSRWAPTSARTTLELTCDRMIWAKQDNRISSRASPDHTCVAEPLWVRAGGETRLSALTRDGQPVRWTATRFALAPALGLAIVLTATAALLGFEGLFMLLAMPLSLLGPRVGLPVEALMWLIAGSAAAGSGAAGAGAAGPGFGTAHWRLWLTAGFALCSFGLAARSVVQRPGGGNEASSAVRYVAAAAIDIGLLQRKVDEVVNRTRPLVDAVRPGTPLVLALGSSSSGGGTNGRFWPDLLQEALAPLPAHGDRPGPAPVVISIAQGGATTWHARRILEALEVRPAACVVYLGQNDTTASMPGLTIAQLERGESSTPGAWVAPMSPQDSKDNLVAIASRCGVTLAMQEYVVDRTEPLAAFASMLQTIPNIHYLDPTTPLTSGPRALLMLDGVHPSPAGQQVLAAIIAARLSPLLASHGDPEPAVPSP